MQASSPPKCACGLYAVGECVDCNAPCCATHGEVALGQFRCAKHVKKALASQRRTEQEARRQAEEAKGAIGAQELERQEQERGEREAERVIALAQQPWLDELERWQDARRIDRSERDVDGAHLLVHGLSKSVCRLEEFRDLDDRLLAELRELTCFTPDGGECERCSTLRDLEASVLAVRLDIREDDDPLPPFGGAERARWRSTYIVIAFEVEADEEAQDEFEENLHLYGTVDDLTVEDD